MWNLSVKRSLFTLLFLSSLLGSSSLLASGAPNRYWIFLHDSSTQIIDLPTAESKLKSLGVKPEFSSKWLHAISANLSDHQLAIIQKSTWVKRVTEVKRMARAEGNNSDFQKKKEKVAVDLALNSYVFEIMRFQTGAFQGNYLSDANALGQGVTILVMDGGYKGVDELPQFKHLFSDSLILETKDFVERKKKRRGSLREDDSFYGGEFDHGTGVLSCIAGYLSPNLPRIAMAPRAKYLLTKIEEVEDKEDPLEDNWIKALEWGYDKGARIAIASIGYTYQGFEPKDMDGETSVVAQAIKAANAKGMICVISMGNSRKDAWHYLATPADAYEALSVGAVNPFVHHYSFYTSAGPNVKKQMKPNVAGPGTVVIPNKKGNFDILDGTSFSAPLVAGYVAAIWSKFPTKSSEEIKELVQQTGAFYPYYDYAHGYGVPQAGKALGLSDTLLYPKLDSADFTMIYDSLDVLPRIKINDSILSRQPEIHTTAPAYFPYLLFSVAHPTTGYKYYYSVVDMGGTGSTGTYFPSENFVIPKDLKSYVVEAWFYGKHLKMTVPTVYGNENIKDKSDDDDDDE